MIRTLNTRRVLNLLKTSASFFLSTLLRKPVIWGAPSILTIEPTNICNLHCPLCTTGAGEMIRPAGRMTLDTFKMIVDQVGDEVFFLLIYHQGEPYLNSDFFEFVRLAKQKNIYVTTSTNGHYFSPQNVRKTISCGLDSMIVSVDGVTQASYARYRSGGTLKKVITGTKLLIEERKKLRSRTPNIALQFLVMKHNESEIPAMRRLAGEIGADRFLVKSIEVHSVAEGQEWLPNLEKYRRYHFDGQNLIVKNSGKKYCTRPWLSTLVNWDGTVVPCCFDKNGKYSMGILRPDAPFGMVWLNESLNSFRQKLITNRQGIDICSNCNQGLGNFLPKRFWRKKG